MLSRRAIRQLMADGSSSRCHCTRSRSIKPSKAWRAETHATPQPASRRRVLLVDDDQHGAKSLRRLVGALGHDVEVAFSGEAALQVAEELQPQIVLRDISLPGWSGYTTAHKMRSRSWARRASLVAMTGWAREVDQRRAIDAGSDCHLTKPVSVDVLETLLNTSTVQNLRRVR